VPKCMTAKNVMKCQQALVLHINSVANTTLHWQDCMNTIETCVKLMCFICEFAVSLCTDSGLCSSVTAYHSFYSYCLYCNFGRKCVCYVCMYRVAQNNVYTLWHEKYYSIIITTVFIQKQNWYERCPWILDSM